MSASRLTPRQVSAPEDQLRWDPIVVDLTPADVMIELDPPLALESGK